MAIPIEKEPEELKRWDQERCCFCRTKTEYWTKIVGRKPGEQVACCPECADKASTKDVPGKIEWCCRERIAGDR